MKIKGPWTAQQVGNYLAETIIPVRIAVLTPSGSPLVLSLWFLPRDGALWCACNKRARVIELLREDPRCGFEIASEIPPYRGVRGQGQAWIDAPEGPAVLELLLARYRIAAGSRLAGMLRNESANEVAIRIVPDWMTSWDFSARMGDAFSPDARAG